MTDLETAKIIAKADALEIAHNVRALSERQLSDPIDYASFQRKIQDLMYATMKVVSPNYSEFFSQPSNRTAYYASFAQHMRQVGLLQQESESQIPQPHAVHQ